MELESIINEAPNVLESAAIGVPSELGEEDIKIFVIPNSENFSPQALLQHLESRLPRFMMPRYVVTVDSFPKTPTEKVKKKELRDLNDVTQTWDSMEEA
jgi:crotonobetaine/carnitine-CoA ligase